MYPPPPPLWSSGFSLIDGCRRLKVLPCPSFRTLALPVDAFLLSVHSYMRERKGPFVLVNHFEWSLASEVMYF